MDTAELSQAAFLSLLAAWGASTTTQLGARAAGSLQAWYAQAPARQLVWLATRAGVEPRLVMLTLLDLCAHALGAWPGETSDTTSRRIQAELRAWADGAERHLGALWAEARDHYYMFKTVRAAQTDELARLAYTRPNANAAGAFAAGLEYPEIEQAQADITRRHLPYELLAEALARHARSR